MPSCVVRRMAASRLRANLKLLGTGMLLAAIPGALQAQQRIPPPHFAIQNACIVTGSGQSDAIDLAKKNEVQTILTNPRAAWKVAERLVEEDVPVMPTQSLPPKRIGSTIARQHRATFRTRPPTRPPHTPSLAAPRTCNRLTSTSASYNRTS